MKPNIKQEKAINANENKILCVSGAGTGKALPNSTVIPTPEGNKRVDEIKVGDYLFDRLGRPTKVLGVFPQGKKEVYKLYFSDGFTAKCCKEHLWSVKHNPCINEYNEKTVDEIMRNFSWTYFYIPGVAALQIEKENEDMTVDEAVNCLLNNTEEVDKLIYCSASFKEKVIEKLCEITHGRQHIDDSNCVYYAFTFGEEEGLTDKTIKSIFYFLKSAGYSTQIFELKNCEDYWFASFNAYLYRENYSIQITNIERLGYEEEMTCFYVDNSEHLFLTENFIVTHNTTVLTQRIERLLNENTKPEEIVAITFTNLAAEEMRQRLGEKCKGMFIGTFHSYANYICQLNGIDTSKHLMIQDFDKIIEKVLLLPKEKYPKIKYLLVDEFQDTNYNEYTFMLKIQSENIFCVGDSRQQIYDFSNGDTSIIMKDLYTDDNYAKYYLDDNYRCPKNILEYAEEKIKGIPKIGNATKAYKQHKGYINECPFREAVEELTWDGLWGNWFIICRTNADVEAAMDILKEKGIPNVTFKKADLDYNGMQDILRQNNVKVLTIHACKGLEAKNVIVVGAKNFSPLERRIAYVAATRAQQSLFWCPQITKRGTRAKKKNMGEIAGANQEFVSFM